MILRKNQEVSLKLRYPITVRMTTLISVIMLIMFSVAFPRFEAKEFLDKEIQIEIEQFDIPQTQQFDLPPPPSRPPYPWNQKTRIWLMMSPLKRRNWRIL